MRSAVVVLLTISLIQPTWHVQGNPISVVYLLDISRSISPAAIESGLKWIQEANQFGQPSHARFIAFGQNSLGFDDLRQVEDVSVSAEGNIDGSIAQTGSNIQDALKRGLQTFASNHLKRLVLISDGNETIGRMSDMTQLLKQEQVRVFTVPAAVRGEGDAWVESIQSPMRVRAEEPFRLNVNVYSLAEGVGEVEIRSGRSILGKTQTPLRTGVNVVEFLTRITEEAGPVTMEAELRMAEDRFTENNVLRQGIVVQGRPRLLYVEGHLPSAHYLQQALQREGFLVDVRQPDMMPVAVDQLVIYDAIVLSDVERISLTDQHIDSIVTYVRDLGGGLIFAGGENTYGEYGYSKTPLERILPVTFEAEPTQPVTLIVILDRSGSMGGLKMELAKEATKASVAVLRDKDRFGVIGFDNAFYWPVPTQTAANRDAIIESISKIIPGGDTNMYPPMEEAFKHLADATTEVKHIILLSDGVSLPGDFQGIVRKMVESKMTVSSVSVSIGSDRRLLAQIADWGKGRSYYIEDPNKVPQIFTQETQLASGRTLREESFRPTVIKNIDAFAGIDLESAPSLAGYVATTAKDNSEVIMESEAEHPILARWRYGLGRTVVFASDVKDRWASQWLTWKDYGKFWSQLIRETMRKNESDHFDLRVNRVNDEAEISLQAMEPGGAFRNMLRPGIRMVTDGQDVVEVTASQVAPGSYMGLVPLRGNGPWLFTATDGDVTVSQVMPNSYPDEYHFHPTNTGALQRISDETGGTYQPSPEQVFLPDRETVEIPIPLWPYAAVLALLAYFADVFLRRRRLFEDGSGGRFS